MKTQIIFQFDDNQYNEWKKVNIYCPIYGSYYAEFDSEKGACDYYDKITEKTII